MSAKLIPAMIAAIFIANTVHAATRGTEPSRAGHAAPRTASPAEVVSEFHSNYIKSHEELLKEGKKEPTFADIISKMNNEKGLQTFNRATEALSAETKGLQANSIRNLILSSDQTHLPKEVLLKRIADLGVMLKQGGESKEHAEVMIELMEAVSIRLHELNPKTDAVELEFVRVLMSIDLQKTPSAFTVVKIVAGQLIQGKVTFKKAIEVGMLGIRGTIEQFVALCGRRKAA
jgi:hypothetical protein